VYGTGFEGNLETRIRPIILLETPTNQWPTPTIAFYKSTGTSNENSDYRKGTWYPIYGYGISPNDKTDQLPKYLKMSDYKSQRGFPVIVEIDQLRISFYDWLKQKKMSPSMIDRIVHEIFNNVIILYFANIWQIKTSICLSLKSVLQLSKFEEQQYILNPNSINDLFYDCVWKNTINDVNFLFFVHFFLLVVGDIPAYPQIVQNINRVYDEKQEIYLEKFTEGKLTEQDINDDELITFLNENNAQMPSDLLENPNTFLEFRRFYIVSTALIHYGNEIVIGSKKGGRKTYRKKRRRMS
jgi:hypothetical protein